MRRSLTIQAIQDEERGKGNMNAAWTLIFLSGACEWSPFKIRNASSNFANPNPCRNASPSGANLLHRVPLQTPIMKWLCTRSLRCASLSIALCRRRSFLNSSPLRQYCFCRKPSPSSSPLLKLCSPSSPASRYFPFPCFTLCVSCLGFPSAASSFASQ